MKKYLLLILVVLTLFISGCAYKNPDALKFKEDYESLNGQKNAKGKEYRNITVDEDNPFVFTTVEELNKKIDNKESFIAYFGANWCPWCRSMLATSITKAKENKIEKIYYIDVRPGNDIKKDIRDIYSKDEDGKIYLSHSGTDAYKKFTTTLKDILKDYKAGDVDVKGTEFEGAKRIGAPTFIMVKEGKGVTIVNGTSSLQTDAYMDITEEMQKDMDKIFDDFYKRFK